MQDCERSPPFVPRVAPVWCYEVTKFLDDLAENYYRKRVQPDCDVLLTDFQQYIVSLYLAYEHKNILPAFASKGSSYQNPRLMDAFIRLKLKDAQIAKDHAK